MKENYATSHLLILRKTPHQLRCLAKQVYQAINWLKFKLVLDETFIGKIAASFDFLGYHFLKQGLISFAKKR